MDTDKTDSASNIDMNKPIPVLPLRDVVVYPHMVIPLFVGREKSINALDLAMDGDKQIVLLSQKSADIDDPSEDDIYTLGTVATILQLLKLPDGTVKVLVEGVDRVQVSVFSTQQHCLYASVDLLKDKSAINDKEMDVLMNSVSLQFEQYVKMNKKIPPEVLTSLGSIDEPSRLADTVAAHMSLKLEEKQQVLELVSVSQRLEHLIGLMEAESEIMHMEKKIRSRVKKQMEKNQREYYLNEQMKAIQSELGEMEDAPNEIDELQKRIDDAGMPKEALEKVENELKKLKLMSPMSAEATVVRNYIEAVTGVPWDKRDEVTQDIDHASDVLESDHYGLDKVKERILEYLAVQQRVRKLKGPILCLVGPPGVGKTSVGESIARATGRKFVRMALGGVRDEAEIRGHRRTYIGALPGKIMQNLTKVGSKNPLFLLDEIDKMAMDFRGDPASALLEVLDPEQNHTFSDHYMEVDFDLSEIMFVATANSMNMPAALLDRMEVIHLSGYTEDEKLNIAKRYLLPKQLKNNGLESKELQVRDTSLTSIIRHYTREAGVRNLEREVSKICRKVVKEILVKKRTKGLIVASKNLDKYLGVERFRYGLAEENDRVGQVTGLAWTEVGGELLHIESALVPGKGRLSYTGKLGEVMQESIQAAMTVVRSRADSLGLEKGFHEKYDLHVHVPEGATPKDGPSAGVGMCTTLVSALTNIPVKASVAMTGEITLRGEVLPIGGLKEKLLAAHRGGIRTVIIPHDNERDLVDMPKNIKQHLEIIPVRWIEEVLEIALTERPVPLVVEGTDVPADHESDTKKPLNESIRH